jgi:hypothetical protein
VPQDDARGQAADVDRPGPDDRPVLPVKSREDTDVDWGERPGLENDERLYDERPPHWDSV